jgi:hypothetical protein
MNKFEIDDDDDFLEIDWNEFLGPISYATLLPTTHSVIDSTLDIALEGTELVTTTTTTESISLITTNTKQFTTIPILTQQELHYNINLIFTFPIDAIPDFEFFVNGRCS